MGQSGARSPRARRSKESGGQFFRGIFNMMGPDTVAAADYGIAQKPGFGGETNLYVTALPHTEQGLLSLAGVNSGVWTPDTAAAAALSATPQELIAVIDFGDANGGGANIVITVTGTDQDGTSLTGTATISPPGYARVTEKVFPVGYGVDVVPATDGKKFKTITGLAVTCAAGAKGGKVTLFGLPSWSSFTQIGCKTEFDFDTKSRVPKSIACGMDGTAFTKLGRSEEAKFSFKTKLIGHGDGATRYDGVRATWAVQTTKEGRVVTDRTFLLGAIAKVKQTLPDGDSEAMADGSGVFEDVALMPAK